MTLYHGTLDNHVESILSGISVSFGRLRTDFGRGFYTTTAAPQAKKRAWQLFQRRRDSQPAVIGFEVDREELAKLESVWFVRGAFDADDYWNFVLHCRSGGQGHGRSKNEGWYDIAIGPMAAVWERRIAYPEADQVGFHTRRAAQLLDASKGKVIPWNSIL